MNIRKLISIQTRKQNVNEIIDVLSDLREVDIYCNVTLYFQDGEYNRVGRGIHINLDRLPMNILFGQRNYVLKIRYSNETVFMENSNPYRDMVFFIFKQMIDGIKTKKEEKLINKERKRKLDDILNDPNPPPLILI